MKKNTVKEYAEVLSMTLTSRRQGWAATGLCLFIMAVSGCSRDDKELTPTLTTEETGPLKAEHLLTVNAEQIRTLVDYRNGRVVVVNFWASWCPPCVREFPALIKVFEQYRDKGLDVLAVSMNSPAEAADIEQFLQTHNPPFPVYLADAQDEAFNGGVLNGWFGEMPLTLVFNTAGERVLAHRKELTYEELSSTVEALLPQK